MNRIALFGKISEINDHLFLSGAGVLKPDRLREKNVTLIVNATTEEPSIHLNGIDYLRIRIEDSPYAHLDTYFDMVADRIKANQARGGCTLVHCVAGVSRSASLVIVYLVKHQRMTLRQAYHHVKAVRPIIRPNAGFWRQMIDYELRLLGARSVDLVPSVHHERDLVPDVYILEMRRAALVERGVRRLPDTAPPRRTLPLSPTTTADHRRSLSSAPLTSSGGDRPFSYSRPNSYNQYSTLNGLRSSTLSSGRRSTSVAASRLTIPYRNGAATLMLPSAKFRATDDDSSRRRPKSSPTANGTIFSSIYHTSNEMMFPTF